MLGWICSDWADWFWGTMGTEFSILTGKPVLLLDDCSPETQLHKNTWVNNTSQITFAWFCLAGICWGLVCLKRQRKLKGLKLHPGSWATVSFTLNSGGWADNESLLEGFCLATQPSRTRWNRDTLLCKTRNVDGRLLVQSWLVIQQRHRSPRRRHLLKTPLINLRVTGS